MHVGWGRLSSEKQGRTAWGNRLPGPEPLLCPGSIEELGKELSRGNKEASLEEEDRGLQPPRRPCPLRRRGVDE